ncbi:MAG: gamma-glutamyl-gamma-aminobutyrate hydrolase family protein [Burkholderiaceae bacterium]|jgi:putative glutamine amidotransferase
MLVGRSHRRKPLKIAISPRLFHPEPGAVGLRSKPIMYLEDSVAHWVMSRDVMVFMLPMVAHGNLVSRGKLRLGDYVAQLDGLVLQGGADVSPASYNEEPLKPEWSGDKIRDDFERELLMEFVEAGKPVLGICRGAQLINVAFGGTLYQDIGAQHPNAIDHVDNDAYDRHHHEVRIEPGTRLAKLYPGLESGRITSIHHQGVRTLARDVVVEAWSVPDGMPEALRVMGRGYVFGVQWHPEFHRPGDPLLLDSTPILEEFLDAARKRA